MRIISLERITEKRYRRMVKEKATVIGVPLFMDDKGEPLPHEEQRYGSTS